MSQAALGLCVEVRAVRTKMPLVQSSLHLWHVVPNIILSSICQIVKPQRGIPNSDKNFSTWCAKLLSRNTGPCLPKAESENGNSD
jgi:hypothetical protein